MTQLMRKHVVATRDDNGLLKSFDSYDLPVNIKLYYTEPMGPEKDGQVGYRVVAPVTNSEGKTVWPPGQEPTPALLNEAGIVVDSDFPLVVNFHVNERGEFSINSRLPTQEEIANGTAKRVNFFPLSNVRELQCGSAK
jgi:hypothetical protein